ncbi:MAG TPA: uroporphyrinogen decarboxylase family protein [Candidatus Limiplasma sp.]|nr:uroporphyrinogen decarboxylase family protein [Candidatus Limiplasma sp.]HRX09140.1 uroporphyrinogen decarboxylase family protein [Candidatus Limiplasma sp.]
MFQPEYQNFVNAVRNKPTRYLPLYEHSIDPSVMETITGEPFRHLENGDDADKEAFLRHYTRFFQTMGYDTVSFERLVVNSMPGNGCLYAHNVGCIHTLEDFERYPWGKIPDWFFAKESAYYRALRSSMPDGMLAVGGPGNGLFECIQDIVGLEALCFLRVDEPEVYEGLFRAAGDMLCAIWTRFLAEFGDIYCVCRFGDDLGFQSSTLLPVDDIRRLLIPQYKRIVEIIHSHGKPFLLHSCGNIFRVMDDLIDTVGVDAKHSNEDAIAPFAEWISRYGDRIGNIGGLDASIYCKESPADAAAYASDVYRVCEAKGYGAAIGSGNSIPDYVRPDKYLQVVQTIRRLRGC